MLTEKLTYEDFNGKMVTDELHFNLSKARLLKMSAKWPGGNMYEYIKQVQKNNNTEEMLKIFLELVTSSYGKISEDGKHFIQNKEISSEFEDSAAFDALLTKFVEDPNYAGRFITAVLPKDLAKNASPVPLRPLA